MADYLQPGGARYKLTPSEKQNFLFKLRNLDKQMIAGCVLDCVYAPKDHMRTCVLLFLAAKTE